MGQAFKSQSDLCHLMRSGKEGTLDGAALYLKGEYYSKVSSLSMRGGDMMDIVSNSLSIMNKNNSNVNNKNINNQKNVDIFDPYKGRNR